MVLIDTKMKQGDGIDLCRRALAAGKQAVVAILTSYLAPMSGAKPTKPE